MDELKAELKKLPIVRVGERSYISHQTAVNTTAVFLFPNHTPEQIDAAQYEHILKTADTACCEMGYPVIEKLTPPDVQFSEIGLYFGTPIPESPPPDTEIVMVGPGRVEALQDGHLLDARLSQLGVDEVTQQHFKIPVTASDGVIDLMRRAVASKWGNDYRGLWHDILGMCIAAGKDVNPLERHFTVIIRGVGRRRYWRMKSLVKSDHTNAPYLTIMLLDEPIADKLFPLGHVVMTAGIAALNVDIASFLARHEQGDWGELDALDRRQNETAVTQNLRILSAYTVSLANDETVKAWIITEADRSVTTVLLASEY